MTFIEGTPLPRLRHGLCGLLALAAAGGCAPTPGGPSRAVGASLPSSAQPSAARRARLTELVREDCGSCHGSELRGGLGPPLLPGSLRGKDPRMLEQVILDGRPGTPMPPWRRFLSPADARWIVEKLQEGFPNAAN